MPLPLAGAMLLSSAIAAGGSVAGGAIASQGAGETKMQRQRRKLVDELLDSLRGGGGAYSDLFANNEQDFQKGFVEPAMSRFQNQIAPQIQQQYIASGMQKGTGLEDTLTRAGVDLNQLINENYLSFQNQGLNRKQNLLTNIMSGSEAPAQMSPGQGAAQGFAGYMSSPAFGNTLESAFKPGAPQQQQGYQFPDMGRTGYSQSWASNPGYGGAGQYNLPNFNYGR